MAEKKRVYWDACAWIGLINREAAKVAACDFVMGEAEKGTIEIWTSAFTLAEVFKRKCGGATPSSIPPQSDTDFEDFLKKDFVVRVNVDDEVGTEARRLLRQHPSLKKPQDAIHLATAVINNLQEMHTWDNADLIGLVPTVPPPPPPPEPPPLTIF